MTLSKRDQRKELVKESIKKAALELAEESGWGGVSIRKIADKILYSAPVVYEHFENKDDLYKHLVQDGFRLLHDRTLEEMNKSTAPEEQIMAMATVRFQFSKEHATLEHLMFDADHPEWQREALIKSMSAIKERVEEQLAILTGEPTRNMEYFMNLICLMKGYIFFRSKLELDQRMKANLDFNIDIQQLFQNAIKRFIDSIKSDS